MTYPFLRRAGGALLPLVMSGVWLCGPTAHGELSPGEAGIKQKGTQWTLSTVSMQETVALEDGRFLLKSLKDRVTGRELVPANSLSDEFFVSLDTASNRLSGARGNWKLIGSHVERLRQHEQRLDVTLQKDSLQVTKSYEIYPGSSIVRQWVAFKNLGQSPLRIIQPGFLNFTAQPGALPQLDFNWMSGGEARPGAWTLRTEPVKTGKPRTFDSYETFSLNLKKTQPFPGDGIKARIFLNEKPVWPADDWKYVANATVTAPFDFQVQVAKGDKLIFRVNMNKTIGFDTTAFDPTITYDDGEKHTASQEFSGEQGGKGWNYQYVQDGKFVDLVYNADANQWKKAKDTTAAVPFVGVNDQHPDSGKDAVRVWTAPKSGHVRVTGSVCNTGNGGDSSPNYGFRPGTTSYAPWYALYDRGTKQGLFIGWDYFGHWDSSFAVTTQGAVTAQLRVTGYKQTLAPGASVTTPKAFVGLYSDDLDNAGNECLDWQYQYLWDYTRDGWFPAIRMLGYWSRGTSWFQPGWGWLGGSPDYDSTFRKVFRTADLMRYVGADVYHRDWGWWDRAGDWNGPDFRTTINYLHKYGMGQLIYAFLYSVDAKSKVAIAHPDWVLDGTLDMSRPEVVEFMKGQLDEFVQRWGDFEWRNDGYFTAPRAGDDTPLLGQDEGFRQVIRGFLDKHPHSAFQSVNGGGNYGGYDYTRYSSSFSFNDGAVGILRNYYAALLFPPDKTSDVPDIYNPKDYDKSKWRGLLCFNFDMTGDTWDPARLEGVRELVDIYHYLLSKGVVGRWVKVYRPLVQGDDPTLYFQRLSRDRLRGLIIPKQRAPGPVTIKPKGLLPDKNYVVSFQESEQVETRTGASLMAQGIKIEKMAPGELVYLNLPLHPGSKLDHKPPSPPRALTKHAGENMGYPGIELSWKPGTDNNWVSYYEVFRNGMALDKVAKGTFYFDHSAGADLAARYEICTVDGAGNVSAKISAKGRAGNPAQVFDDAVGGPIKYDGKWEHQSGILPAHAGTLSVSSQKGASAELHFTGTRVLLFTQLAADGGKAKVTIDGAAPEVIDTYSADEIWGICNFQRTLPAGPHTLRLEVLGEHSLHSKGNLVHLDGIRIESE